MRSLLTISLVAVAQASVSKPYPATKMSIDTQNRILVDEAGRQVILHGVNVVPKVAPYLPLRENFDPQKSLTDEDIGNLRDWGMNFVRLGVMWESVERAPGVYNMTYLDQVEELINTLGENGFYTLVDAHQDVGARKICGEGFPNFYAQNLNNQCDNVGEVAAWMIGQCQSIDDYGWRHDADGNPLIEDCQKVMFANYYSTPEAIDLFNRLYDNIDGMQDKFIAYWDVVSKKFAGNKYVIGYDPLNEPFPASLFYDPSIFLKEGQFDQAKLFPMFKRAFEKYHKHDHSQIMMFEGTQGPDTIGIGPGYILPVGYQSLPGGNENKATQVLNEHTYCCQMNGEECAAGEPKLSDKELCKSFHDRRLAQRAKDAERLGVPLFISEYGACYDSENCEQEIGQVADACDQNLAGWAYWQFKNFWDLTTSAGTGSEGFYNNDGSLQTHKLRALTRTYLPYTQGVLKSLEYQDGAMTASFALNSQIVEPTVLYVSPDYYFKGKLMQVEIKVEGKTIWQNVMDPANNSTPVSIDVPLSIVRNGGYTELMFTDSTYNGEHVEIIVQPIDVEYEI